MGVEIVRRNTLRRLFFRILPLLHTAAFWMGVVSPVTDVKAQESPCEFAKEANDLLAKGRRDLDARRFKEAIGALGEANALCEHPAIVLALAQSCKEAWANLVFENAAERDGMNKTAQTFFLKFIKLVHDDAEQARRVGANLDNVRSQIGDLKDPDYLQRHPAFLSGSQDMTPASPPKGAPSARRSSTGWLGWISLMTALAAGVAICAFSVRRYLESSPPTRAVDRPPARPIGIPIRAIMPAVVLPGAEGSGADSAALATEPATPGPTQEASSAKHMTAPLAACPEAEPVFEGEREQPDPLARERVDVDWQDSDTSRRTVEGRKRVAKALFSLLENEQVDEVWRVLLWQGPMNRDNAVRHATKTLREEGLVSYERLDPRGALYLRIEHLIDQGRRTEHFDVPAHGIVRAIFPYRERYTNDMWRECLVRALGDDTVDREDAIRLTAAWGRKVLGLRFQRIGSNGPIEKGVRGAINSALRRHEIELVGSSIRRIASAVGDHSKFRSGKE